MFANVVPFVLKGEKMWNVCDKYCVQARIFVLWEFRMGIVVYWPVPSSYGFHAHRFLSLIILCYGEKKKKKRTVMTLESDL